jgi:hypothetical protein
VLSTYQAFFHTINILKRSCERSPFSLFLFSIIPGEKIRKCGSEEPIKMEAVAHRWYSMDKVGINMYHDTTRSSSPIPSSKFNTRRLSQPGLESVPISASLSNTNDINSRKLSQAGLEVGPDPFGNPHAGWPDPSLPVWGIEDQRAEGPKRGLRGLKTLSGVLINGRTFNGHERLVGGCGSGSESGGERSYEKRVAGLSVGVFWGCVLLIVALLAGGIGGGIGAGLAAKRNCPRYFALSLIVLFPKLTIQATSSLATGQHHTHTQHTHSPPPLPPPQHPPQRQPWPSSPPPRLLPLCRDATTPPTPHSMAPLSPLTTPPAPLSLSSTPRNPSPLHATPTSHPEPRTVTPISST